MIRKLVLAAAILALVGTTMAEAQQRPRPRTPQRPAWQDVCCGGPCCARPRAPQPRVPQQRVPRPRLPQR
jgi:hypothetical protein